MSCKKSFLVIAGLMVVFGISAVVMAEEAADRQPSSLVETRPVLPANGFTGRAAKAYEIAAEIPHALDNLYCYCRCKENPKLNHKTLLTCYTNDHASKCEICIKEAEMAEEMTRQGKTADEIRVAVDQYGMAVLKEAKEKDAVQHEHHH